MRRISETIMIMMICLCLLLIGCHNSEQRIASEMNNLIIPSDFRDLINLFQEIRATYYLDGDKGCSWHYIYIKSEEINNIQTDRISLSFGETDDELTVTIWFARGGYIVDFEVTQASHPINDIEFFMNDLIEGIMLLFRVDKHMEKTGQPEEAFIGDIKAHIYCYETVKSPARGIDAIRLYVADFGDFQTIVGREVIETGAIQLPGSWEVIEKNRETTAQLVEKIIIR